MKIKIKCVKDLFRLLGRRVWKFKRAGKKGYSRERKKSSWWVIPWRRQRERERESNFPGEPLLWRHRTIDRSVRYTVTLSFSVTNWRGKLGGLASWPRIGTRSQIGYRRSASGVRFVHRFEMAGVPLRAFGKLKSNVSWRPRTKKEREQEKEFFEKLRRKKTMVSWPIYPLEPVPRFRGEPCDILYYSSTQLPRH